MSDICILGTGMAGFGAAHALREAGKSALLFDKKAHIGGHTASYVYEGGRFTFDEGPHVSFTKDERVKKILADAVNGDYEGYDLDRDGIGDVAYEVKALSSELTDARPALKFFRGTAAMGVVDAVSHALPLLAAQKLLVDTEPLVSVPRIPVP